MHFVLVPDSFKGTLSSSEVIAVMSGEIKKQFPSARISAVPVADGGEGTVNAFLEAVGGTKIVVPVAGPFFEPMEAFYGLLPDGTAVIEMAACAGLPLVEERKNPLLTTTYGVGQLIAHALANGSRKIVLGLGGSATNDGGTGAAAALGIHFLDKQGREFVPTGGTLSRVDRIDASEMNPDVCKAEFITMCDIDNPLCGDNGASAVFGPQKGADGAMVRELDSGLSYLANIIRRDLNKDILDLPGSGAAGGMGGGTVAFFNSELQMGIQTVLDLTGFDALLDTADYVFTGEGKLDAQSLRGKVVIGVSRRAKTKNVAVIAVVGNIGENIGAVYDEGVTAVFSNNREAVDFSVARPRSGKDLALVMENIMRLIKQVKGMLL